MYNTGSNIAIILGCASLGAITLDCNKVGGASFTNIGSGGGITPKEHTYITDEEGNRWLDDADRYIIE